MRVTVLGAGAMGLGIAVKVMADPSVSRVTVCDAARDRLDACLRQLAVHPGAEKVEPAILDVADRGAAIRPLTGCAAAAAALPWPATVHAVRVALAAGVPIVSISRPAYDALPMIEREVRSAEGTVILGCGLEPGLTEIMARRAAEALDHINELHIRCGGIPETPAPPLGYKLLFTGARLPIAPRDAYAVVEGRLVATPRFSEIEPIHVDGVGDLEAWHDGMVPWLVELPALRGVRTCTQKTLRWPGFAATVARLGELGLLSDDLIEVEGVRVSPRRVVDAVLLQRAVLHDDEIDLTVFRVEARGERSGLPYRSTVEMIDRRDSRTGLTAMARVTGFTAAAVALMLARGDITGPGILRPEVAIAGTRLDRLLRELASSEIHFRFSLSMK